MFERFFPDEYVVSTYVIPFERLYEEGYRGVIFASFESLFRQPVQFALAAFLQNASNWNSIPDPQKVLKKLRFWCKIRTSYTWDGCK